MIGVVVAVLTDALFGVLSGIASTAAVFVLTGWRALWPMGAESTSRHARRDEFEPRLEEVVVVAWALAGLILVALLLLLSRTNERSFVALLALAGVAMSWAGLHLMYAARYAYLFTRARRVRSTSMATNHRPIATSCTSATTSE